ncbi:hypothetical protein ACKI1H_27735 [Pseudomonas sp. YH-1]|uniref:hypothetical protein n=1 Tax=Pseudomonas sp. YH-1 TaxID=3384787 RepID=UPI003F7E18CD
MAKGKLGGLLLKGCVALAVLAVVTKIYAALVVLLAIVLLYCLITHPKPTFGFLMIGLLGVLLKKVPDSIITYGFAFVCLCWGISLLKNRPMKSAALDESTPPAEEGGEVSKLAAESNQPGA